MSRHCKKLEALWKDMFLEMNRFNYRGKGFLAHDMQIVVDCQNDLLDVHHSCRRNNDGLHSLVREHLLVIIIESYAVRLEIFPAPFKLRRCGSENSHKFGRRGGIEKIDDVFLANPFPDQRRQFGVSEAPCPDEEEELGWSPMTGRESIYSSQSEV